MHFHINTTALQWNVNGNLNFQFGFNDKAQGFEFPLVRIFMKENVAFYKSNL